MRVLATVLALVVATLPDARCQQYPTGGGSGGDYLAVKAQGSGGGGAAAGAGGHAGVGGHAVGQGVQPVPGPIVPLKPAGGPSAGAGVGAGALSALGSFGGALGSGASGNSVFGGTATVSARDQASSKALEERSKSARQFDNADASAGRWDNQERQGQRSQKAHNQQDAQAKSSQSQASNSYNVNQDLASKVAQKQSDSNDKRVRAVNSKSRLNSRDLAESAGKQGQRGNKSAFTKDNTGFEKIDYSFKKNADTNFNERGGFKEAVGQDNTNSNVYKENQRYNLLSKGFRDAFKRSQGNSGFNQQKDWLSNAGQRQNANNNYGSEARKNDAALRQNLDWNILFDRRDDSLWRRNNARDQTSQQASDVAQKRADLQKAATAQNSARKGVDDRKYYGGNTFGTGAGSSGNPIVGIGAGGQKNPIVGVVPGGQQNPILGAGSGGSKFPIAGHSTGTHGTAVVGDGTGGQTNPIVGYGTGAPGSPIVGHGTGADVYQSGTAPVSGGQVVFAGNGAGTALVNPSNAQGKVEGSGGQYANNLQEKARQADQGLQQQASNALQDAQALQDYNRGSRLNDSVQVNGQRQGKWQTNQAGLKDANSKGFSGANAAQSKDAALTDRATENKFQNSDLEAADKSLQAQALDRINFKQNEVDNSQTIRRKKTFYHDKNEDGFNNEALNFDRDTGNQQTGAQQQAHRQNTNSFNNAADNSQASERSRGFNDLFSSKASNADFLSSQKDNAEGQKNDNNLAKEQAQKQSAAANTERQDREFDSFGRGVSNRQQQLWDKTSKDAATRQRGSEADRSVNAGFLFFPPSSGGSGGFGGSPSSFGGNVNRFGGSKGFSGGTPFSGSQKFGSGGGGVPFRSSPSQGGSVGGGLSSSGAGFMGGSKFGQHSFGNFGPGFSGGSSGGQHSFGNFGPSSSGGSSGGQHSFGNFGPSSSGGSSGGQHIGSGNLGSQPWGWN